MARRTSILALLLPVACRGAAPAAPSATTPARPSSNAAVPSADNSPSAPPALTPLNDADLARVAASPVALRSNVVPPGKTQRYGHAEIAIHGPADAVRAVLLDFGHYKDIVPRKFKNAHVVGKQDGRTDLYMQVPIMHGMIMLWDILRFGPFVATSEGERLEGTFVKGNVRDAHIVLTMRGVGPASTLLKCDLLILPKVPAPQSAVDEELRDAAGDALDGIKARVEKAAPQTEKPPATPPPSASPPPAPG